MHTYDADFIWLVRGKQRKLVFAKLKIEFLPNALRKEVNQGIDKHLSLREISRHVTDFEKRKLVQCINKNDPYNRIYILTSKGKRLQRRIIRSNI